MKSNILKLNNLSPNKERVSKKKRKGRGPGSGLGKTSGRGHKGLGSRSGGKVRAGFEGGQMPLQRRVPKFGFTNPNRRVFKAVNLGDLQKLHDSKKIKDKIDLELMVKLGLVKKDELVKILSKGSFNIKLDVTSHQFSASAQKTIEKNGGKVTKVE